MVRCPDCGCGPGVVHLRTEVETKHCKTCGREVIFHYHVIRGKLSEREHRVPFTQEGREVIAHLAACNPALLAKAGVTVKE